MNNRKNLSMIAALFLVLITATSVVSGDGTELIGKVDHLIPVPHTVPALLPVLTTIPLQLLAYHMAIHRNLDVDQPRNLAKSVTVE